MVTLSAKKDLATPRMPLQCTNMQYISISSAVAGNGSFYVFFSVTYPHMYKMYRY